MTQTDPVRFAIIGAGWRAEFFLRIAQALPERFAVTGALLRNPEKARDFTAKWGVPAVTQLDALLATGPAFVVVSVPRRPAVAPEFLTALAEHDVPVLCETPPAGDLQSLVDLWRLVEGGARIQVAEQYLFQPHHAARLAIIRSGAIGTPSYAHVSFAHEYHAMSMVRLMLDKPFANARITAHEFTAPLVAGPNRAGPPGPREQINPSRQVLASIDFGDALALYDFALDQYMSWVRSHRVLVRRERGEIADERITYLTDPQTPVSLPLERIDTGHGGNLEGHYLKGITAGTEWIYRNPFPGASLSDEEVAIATCLDRMQTYCTTGEAFYSYADAAQDQYLSLCVEDALRTSRTVETQTQPWAS